MLDKFVGEDPFDGLSRCPCIAMGLLAGSGSDMSIGFVGMNQDGIWDSLDAILEELCLDG